MYCVVQAPREKRIIGTSVVYPFRFIYLFKTKSDLEFCVDLGRIENYAYPFLNWNGELDFLHQKRMMDEQRSLTIDVMIKVFIMTFQLNCLIYHVFLRA